jgi:HK97 family phage major capsid protein
VSTSRRFFLVENVRASDGAVELSFSSSAPVDMGGVREILEHTPEAVDLARLNASAPVLFEHDRERVVGVVDRAWIDGNRGRARIRFGTTDLAKEVARDVAAGIRRNVSVGYQVVKAATVAGVRYVRNWQPFEISIVSVPADTSVGFGRSLSPTTTQPSTKMNLLKQYKEKRGAALKELDALTRKDALTDDETARIRTLQTDITKLDGQITVEQSTLESAVRSHRTSAGNNGDEHVDISRYSLTRALHLAATGRLDGLELEVSQEEARRAGRSPNGIFVPLSALVAKRDLTATGGTSGSEGGATFTPSTGGFIDALRPRLVLAGLGATFLGGLTSDVKLPRQGAASTAGWKTENASLDEQSPEFDQVALTPRRCGAFTEISKQLLVQSSLDVENLVRNDLLSAVAVAIDAAGIAGSGTAPTPRGIINTSGIGSVAMGTNGGAPTWDKLVDLLAAISNVDADIGTIKFLSNPKVRAKLQKTIYDAGSGLNLLDKASTLGSWAWTSNVPSTLTKGTASGVCSAIVAGDFSQLVVGQFGGAADVVVDPYTKATEGLTRVVLHTFADVAVRRAAFFAAILDATTT